MEVNYSLILAAGKGTRMGNIGKILPKVLWPLFEKTLLEAQIDFAKFLNISNIYANIFAQKEQIENFYNKNLLNKNLKLIREDFLLDIGGAIHNFARLKEIDYKGTLLILNCDQFLFFDFSIIEKEINQLSKDYAALLFCFDVDQSSGYNEIMIDSDSNLINVRIAKDIPRDLKKYLTYSGISVIKLDSLAPTLGASAFFDSVCDYKNKKIKVVKLKNYEYWDFGTAERYKNSMFKVLDLLTNSEMNSNFVKFLIEKGIFNRSKYFQELRSYGLNYNKNTINLVKHAEKLIIDQAGLSYGKIFDNLS